MFWHLTLFPIAHRAVFLDFVNHWREGEKTCVVSTKKSRLWEMLNNGCGATQMEKYTRTFAEQRTLFFICSDVALIRTFFHHVQFLPIARLSPKISQNIQ